MRAGDAHNISVYTDSTATNQLFDGDSVWTRHSITYNVSLPTGVYFFRCDFHPRSMTGVPVVK